MRTTFAIFLTIVLTVWSLMHAFVFRRLASLPWVSAHLSNGTLALIAVTLWLSYPVARLIHAAGPDAAAVALEWIGSIWMGVVFLLFSSLLCGCRLSLPSMTG